MRIVIGRGNRRRVFIMPNPEEATAFICAKMHTIATEYWLHPS